MDSKNQNHMYGQLFMLFLHFPVMLQQAKPTSNYVESKQSPVSWHEFFVHVAEEEHKINHFHFLPLVFIAYIVITASPLQVFK